MGGSRESVCTHKPPAESHSSPRGEEERGSLSCFPTLPCQLLLLAAGLLRAAHAASRAAAGAGTGRASPPGLLTAAPLFPALLQSYSPALLYPCAPEPTWLCIPTFLHPCILSPAPMHPCTLVPPAILYPCATASLYPHVPESLHFCAPASLHPCAF